MISPAVRICVVHVDFAGDDEGEFGGDFVDVAGFGGVPGFVVFTGDFGVRSAPGAWAKKSPTNQPPFMLASLSIFILCSCWAAVSGDGGL